MILDRTNNALRNIFWGFIERIILLLFPFITRTVLIKVLGVDYVGLNALFTSILAVLSVSELGIGSAIVFSMYKPIAKDDNETLCALLNLYRKIYHIIGFIILGLGLLLLPFLHILVKGEVPSDVNLYLLYLIFLFNTVISYFLFAYKTALFSAFQRNDVVSKRNSMISVFSNIIQIGLLLTLHNYYAYVLVIPLGTVLTNLINSYYAGKMYPEITCKGEILKDLMSDIKKRIVGLMSYKIYDVVYFSVDAVIISAFLGIKSLALYNNYIVIISIFTSVLSIIHNSMTAGIGNKMVCESRENNYCDFKNLIFAYGWISGFFVVLMFCTFQDFITLWIGKEFLLPIITIILLLIHFMLSKLVNAFVYIYRVSAGLWWEDRFRPLVQTFINIFLSLILVSYYGINGVISATLFCSIFIAIPWGTKILFKYYFKMSAKEYYKKTVFYSLVTLLTSFVCYELCNNFIQVNSWLTLFLKGFVILIVSNVIFWLLYHKQEEFKFLKSFVKGYLKKYLFNI